MCSAVGTEYLARFLNRGEEGRYFVTMSGVRSLEVVKRHFYIYIYIYTEFVKPWLRNSHALPFHLSVMAPTLDNVCICPFVKSAISVAQCKP